MPAVGQGLQWPLPLDVQAGIITQAVAAYRVPIQVFMGMYNNETTLGANVANSSAGAVGPFQFEPATAATYGYPLTNTPTDAEFRRQANAAAHYLHDLYIDFVPTKKTWRNALAAYNAGPGRLMYGFSYADAALAFVIPPDWAAALGAGPATAGGVANAGGTGTLPNDTGSGFSVGDPTNPDEDFWTAINRIAQARYWYCWSDGETFYLADGPDLMKQTPAMDLDRVKNADQISHLEATFDNVAWRYAATHKKRKRAQRRSSLARVTSPVEAQLNAICAIDEVRAGDVVKLSNIGPGDGQWLVGDCRRSVFEVTSEINLVVALSPLTEGELNPAGINTNNSPLFGGTLGTGNVKGYVNPVGTWTPSRIDQGVDGTLTNGYVAPGDSVILIANRSDPGWAGGGYLAGKLVAGPLKGLVWYVAEGIAPVVAVGDSVKAGTSVAMLEINPYNGTNGNIETGWADPNSPGRPLAQSLPGYGGDQSPQAMAAGNSFNRFIVKLGGAPASAQGSGVHVAPASMPGGYP